jgi:hypothetical protein
MINLPPPPNRVTEPVTHSLLDKALELVAETRTTRNLPEPAVDLVYHYTTVGTLCALARPTNFRPAWSIMRASSLAFMNDRQEFLLGHRLISEAWKTVIDAEQDGPLRTALITAQSAVAKDKLHAHALDVYALCFCEDGDLLSQWRGYADFGKGVSLGLNLQRLKETVNGHGFWVVYDPIAQADIAAKITREIRDRLALIVNSGNLALVELELRDWIPVLMSFVYSILKHESFESEKEYRVLHTGPLAPNRLVPQFRDRGAALIPYVELDFYNKGLIPLQEVVLGPGASWPSNLEAMKLLFRTPPSDLYPGRDPMAIRVSRVPLV